MPEALLNIEHLDAYYGKSHVLQDVNLQVHPAELVVVVGRNGMGKTTLLKSVMGLPPLLRTGSITFDGQETAKMPTHDITNLGIGYVPQGRMLFPTTLFRSWRKFDNQRRYLAKIAHRVGLEDKLDITVDELSHGEHRQLELGITLAHKPRILLLDEPMAGLSVAERRFMTELIMSLKSEITVVIIEHDIDVAFSIADQVSVLHHGAIIAEGSPEQIENNREVQQIYTLSRQSQDSHHA